MSLPEWSRRFDDNRFKGIVSEIEQMIDDCDQYETLMRLGTTLKNGLGGRAINKAREIQQSTISSAWEDDGIDDGRFDAFRND